MNYLLSPIRRELEQRIGSATTEPTGGLTTGGLIKDGLIIDFLNSDLLPNNPTNRHYSLLEESILKESIDEFELEVQPLAQPLAQLFPQSFAQSFDGVVINLQSSWLPFENLMMQVKPLLRPGGVLYFSAFGPDTLAEIQYSWSQADALCQDHRQDHRHDHRHDHVHPFVDMHHLGDILLQAGFIKPVVDTDWIYINYPNIDVLFDDLKQEGFTNIYSQRRKTLTGKHRFEKFKRTLIEVATKDGDIKQGNINITFEIIYGFAKLPDRSDQSIRVTPPSISDL